MGNVKVKVRVSHLARGTVNGTEEIKTVLSRGQEFTCSEEEAKRLGTSVIVIEKVNEPVTVEPIQNKQVKPKVV
jgi:hypothetical protein